MGKFAFQDQRSQKWKWSLEKNIVWLIIYVYFGWRMIGKITGDIKLGPI